MLVAGFLNEARQPGTHADFSVVGCGEYIERKLLLCTTLSCSRQRGRVEDYLSTCQRRKRQQNVPIVHGHSLEIEVRKRNVRSGSRPRISCSEASFPLYFILFFQQGRQNIGG